MTTLDERDPIDFPSGITILPSQDDALEKLLDELVEKCPAQFILLSEASGQILSIKGERGSADIVALSSLVAGDLAASQEIARLTGQYESFQSILREGPQSNTFISEAGPHMILFVRVSRTVPLGWARLLIQETARQAMEIVSTRPSDLSKLELGLDEEKLSELIGDGLDSLWNG